jgi:hypothetical protein
VAWNGFVQATDAILGAIAANGTKTIHFTSNTVAGNRAFVIVSSNDNGVLAAITGVADAKNGAYHNDLTVSFADGGFNCSLGIWSVSLGTQLLSTDNITVTWGATGAVQAGRLGIIEASALSTAANAVDVSHSASSAGTATNAPSSGATAATTAANEAVLRVYSDDGYGLTWSTPPTGTARINQMSDVTNAELWASIEDSGASSSTPLTSGTLSGTANWAAAAVVYKLAAAAATCPARVRVALNAVRRASYNPR